MTRHERIEHLDDKAAPADARAVEALPGRVRSGLYDSAHEHDACGIGMICRITNEKDHGIIEKGLQILRNLEHRGAVGADPEAGDGCGILIQMPDAFFRKEAEKLGIALPPEGEYAIAFLFLPRDDAKRAAVEKLRR